MIALPAATRVLQEGLAARAFSAVSAEIGDSRGPRWTFAAGRLGFDSGIEAHRDTVFDLASLTKVIATTTIALRLVRSRALDLNAPVATLIPEWHRDDRIGVHVADLLEHSSGLPAYREYFRGITGLDAYVTAIASEPLEYPPRSKAVYSDLGFITLGAILERVGRAPLFEQFENWKRDASLTEPLAYLPPADWKARTALTENDTWRGRVLQGEVHDENAAALGGVAAHAGLFGTAAAVGAAARWWMQQLSTTEGQRFVRRSRVPGSSRALGWDTMLPTSSCGESMSPDAIGHTGFTGTTLWIDPRRERYFVLLTNRVHATRAGEAIQRVRREFHNAANAELT